MRIAQCCLLLLWGSVCVYAQEMPDFGRLEMGLRADLQGKVLMLRGFPENATISFDSLLNPTGEHRVGSWTQAEIRIEKIQANDQEIEILGKRVGFAFDRRRQALTKTQLKVPIKVVIHGPFNGSTENLVASIKDKVFLVNFDEASAPMPELLKDYFDHRGSFGKSGEECVGRGMQHPRVIFSPGPGQSVAARGGSVQGVVVLSVLVGSNGEVSDLHVTAPMGLGLDEKAAEAVRSWKFEPGKKKGNPVACRINIEVSFNLY